MIVFMKYIVCGYILLSHKGSFKYYITHFWMISDTHPPPVTPF